MPKFYWAVSVATLAIVADAASGVTIPTVPVGNAGNSHDFTGYGRVDYAYRIGTTEVTNAQYTEFLNAKATSDPLKLYNPSMGIDGGGITRTGVSGSFVYATKPNWADKPVNHVSWYDTIRFTNWLSNGQGSGDTETGTYLLTGNTPTPLNASDILRNSTGTWFLPSENEWYKAAYHQPNSQGGPLSNYWDFPTTSNIVPTIATANSVGDIGNPGPNVANYNGGANWEGFGNLTSVGSAGPLSASYYGTFDQGGNVREWNEGLSGAPTVARGGAYVQVYISMYGTHRVIFTPTWEDVYTGFRVATVPEPSTVALAAVGLLAFAGVAVRRSAFRQS